MDRNKSQVTSHKSQDIRHKSQVISRRLSVDRLMGVRLEKGTAFILVVMLVTLLAVIGTMFLLRARVGRLSASAMRQNSELNNAVDTVVAAISQQLVVDTPGVDVDSNGPRQEYYDYPDPCNMWLANLEPFLFSDNGTPNDSTDDIYHWRQISDVTGYLKNKNFPTQNINVKPVGLSTTVYVREYPIIKVDSEGRFWDSSNNVAVNGVSADADGDGIADSKWIELTDIKTGRGEPVFAAVRVIDNGGMLNVNTAYKFAPNSLVQGEIDGSSQLQINLMALSWRLGSKPYNSNDEETLIEGRRGIYPFGEIPRSLYENGVIWQYGNAYSGYTPFDISDELEIRNRFLINNEDIKTRLEELWTWSFNAPTEFNTPVGSGELDEWFKSSYSSGDPNIDPNYSYRHLATTYNMDRIINPLGRKMVNVNRPEDIDRIYEAITSGLADAGVNDSALANQLTANLIDFVDTDSNVTIYGGKVGFEQPCVYISELAYLSVISGPNTYNHYAIELYKPYFKDADPIGWELVIDGNSIPIDWSTGSRRFYVRFFADINDPNAGDIANSIDFIDPSEPNDYDPNNYRGTVDFDAGFHYPVNGNRKISLRRPVGGQYIEVDQYIDYIDPNWLVPGSISSIQRDISPHKCIRHLWSESVLPDCNLGSMNRYIDPDPNIIQAHPKNSLLINIGEIGMVLQKNAYSVSPSDTQKDVLVDLTNPVYQQLFNYLTVIDPNSHGKDADEVRVQGRININTAPWFVIAQLPWVSSKVGYNDTMLAQNIAAYREVIGGYKSIGQLNNNIIPGMQYYRDIGQQGDQQGFPDVTAVKEFEPGDGAADDFEERDLIFARISDLVTVRSDVFTAYILVRLGQNGPQKRVMAILDRSDVRNEGGNIVGSVKIRSLYPVPDAR